MNLMEKLEILSDSAKYDVACTSSGVNKTSNNMGIGSASKMGICHSFSADGRCISLLKVLMTNYCIYDCKYCINRKSNDVKRVAFTPRELADLTMNFYKRNYIEGLFLSSGIIKNPDYTCEKIIEVVRILREEYHFFGYIHAKAIPGADEALLQRLGMLVDRMSVNIEMPTEKSLNLLAPDKSKKAILDNMKIIDNKITENKHDIVKYKKAPKFAPAGQSTQMIVGATGETDYQILRLTEGLYKKYSLKRVFYSAYIPVVDNPLLPSKIDYKPPLLREHRLYQADWLLRFYGFNANELLDEKNQSFNPLIDPKCNWAINNMDLFPVDINKASFEMLLRVPGIGVKSARRIVIARKSRSLDFTALKKIGVVLKRAQYFITCSGKLNINLNISNDNIIRSLISEKGISLLDNNFLNNSFEQLTLFPQEKVIGQDIVKSITGEF